jgi:2-phospho-L-lactate transferase/gluconeogenesis factor (CofD/UPF0052 family)
LVNPDFLGFEVIKKKVEKKKKDYEAPPAFLEHRIQKQQKTLTDYDIALEFSKTMKNNKGSKSQWGTLLQKGLQVASKENPKEELKKKLFENEDALMRKKQEAKWKGIDKLIKKFIEESNTTVEAYIIAVSEIRKKIAP